MPGRRQTTITVRKDTYSILVELQKRMGVKSLQDVILELITYYADNELHDEEIVERCAAIKSNIEHIRELYAPVLERLEKARKRRMKVMAE